MEIIEEREEREGMDSTDWAGRAPEERRQLHYRLVSQGLSCNAAGQQTGHSRSMVMRDIAIVRAELRGDVPATLSERRDVHWHVTQVLGRSSSEAARRTGSTLRDVKQDLAYLRGMDWLDGTTHVAAVPLAPVDAPKRKRARRGAPKHRVNAHRRVNDRPLPVKVQRADERAERSA